MGFVEVEFILDLEIELWVRFLKPEKQRKTGDKEDCMNKEKEFWKGTR